MLLSIMSWFVSNEHNAYLIWLTPICLFIMFIVEFGAAWFPDIVLNPDVAE